MEKIMTKTKLTTFLIIGILLLNFAGISYAEFIEERRIDRNRVQAGYWIPPTVEVEHPNDNDEYEVGKKLTIQWKAKSPHHDIPDLTKIDIFLLKEDDPDFELQIADDTENDEGYDWYPTEDLIGEGYLIRVHAIDGYDLEGEDVSDEAFSIVVED